MIGIIVALLFINGFLTVLVWEDMNVSLQHGDFDGMSPVGFFAGLWLVGASIGIVAGLLV